MRVAILGGHGRVARLVTPLLREAGHEVRSIIRNPDHADAVAALGAEPLVADVETMSVEQLVDALEGADAVVWSAGAGGGNPKRTYAVDRDAAIRSFDAARGAGIRRYVMVSYFGARPDHGVEPDSSFFPYAEAKAAADEALRATDLDWTTLGPSTLTDDHPTGRILVDEMGSGRVPRADVAAVVVAALADPATVRRTILFSEGPTPIADALAARD